MFLVRLIAAAALLGGSAAAQQPAPVQPPAPAQGPATATNGAPITVTGEMPEPEPKLVCKQTTTGTILRKQVCKTEAEWSRAGHNSEETLRALRDWQRVRCSFGMRC